VRIKTFRLSSSGHNNRPIEELSHSIMDTTNVMNDEIKETSRVRFSIDRHHSSSLSLAGLSYASSTFEGDDEETQHSVDVYKSSRPGIPHSLAWSMSSETNEESSWTREETEEFDDDVRQDDRQRLMTEESNGRERLLSTTDDGLDYSRDTTPHQVSSHQCEPLVLKRPAPVASCFRVKSCPDVSRFNASSPVQITACFRATSCPEMPNLDCESRTDYIDGSERVELAIRRTRAFTEESFEYQNSMRTQKKVRLFNRSDSMLIDSTYGSADFSLRQESPTAVWVYWEENLELQFPIASSVMQPQQF